VKITDFKLSYLRLEKFETSKTICVYHTRFSKFETPKTNTTISLNMTFNGLTGKNNSVLDNQWTSAFTVLWV